MARKQKKKLKVALTVIMVIVAVISIIMRIRIIHQESAIGDAMGAIEKATKTTTWKIIETALAISTAICVLILLMILWWGNQIRNSGGGY